MRYNAAACAQLAVYLPRKPQEQRAQRHAHLRVCVCVCVCRVCVYICKYTNKCGESARARRAGGPRPSHHFASARYAGDLPEVAPSIIIRPHRLHTHQRVIGCLTCRRIRPWPWPRQAVGTRTPRQHMPQGLVLHAPSHARASLAYLLQQRCPLRAFSRARQPWRHR